ncbi:hypothetical protein [Paucimonas lemoignei]|nr:hypothetical protein [Paucimonas lemoignei]
MDRLLGDVLLELPGTVRLFEFKRSSNKSAKEHDKAKLLRTAISGAPALEPVSRAIHWYVQSFPVRQDEEPRILLSPYLDFGTTQSAAKEDLAVYIQNLVNDALNPHAPRADPNLVRAYLDFVSTWNGAGSVSTGGMLVHIDGKGCLRYAVLPDIRELSLQHSMYVDRYLNGSHERTRDNSHQHQDRHKSSFELGR